jgi:hypothetical protein
MLLRKPYYMSTTIAQGARRAPLLLKETNMSKKTPKPVKQPKPAPKTFVLFGTDEYAKPRAARFSATDPEPLVKASESLHLRMVEVTGEDLAEIAPKLPAGRLHASGRGLVPYIKGDLYFDLALATLVGYEAPANPDPSPQELPRGWDDIVPGNLVIVKETAETGWWEAVVIERNGDLLTARYRDYPKYPTIVRHRSAVAMISRPAQPAEASA